MFMTKAPDKPSNLDKIVQFHNKNAQMLSKFKFIQLSNTITNSAMS